MAFSAFILATCALPTSGGSGSSRKTNGLAELQRVRALQTYESMAIGVDLAAAGSDQIAIVSCTPTDSGTTFTDCSFDVGSGSDW